MHTAPTFSFARAIVLAVVVGLGCRSDTKIGVRPSPPSVIITKPADGTETYPYRDVAFEAEVSVRDGSDVSEVEARWVGNDTVLRDWERVSSDGITNFSHAFTEAGRLP